VLQEEQRRQRETEVFEHLRKKPGRERIDETLVQLCFQWVAQSNQISKYIAPYTTNESEAHCILRFNSLLNSVLYCLLGDGRGIWHSGM